MFKLLKIFDKYKDYFHYCLNTGHGWYDCSTCPWDEPRHSQAGHDCVAGCLPRQTQGPPLHQHALFYGEHLQHGSKLPEAEDEGEDRSSSSGMSICYCLLFDYKKWSWNSVPNSNDSILAISATQLVILTPLCRDPWPCFTRTLGQTFCLLSMGAPMVLYRSSQVKGSTDRTSSWGMVAQWSLLAPRWL